MMHSRRMGLWFNVSLTALYVLFAFFVGWYLAHQQRDIAKAINDTKELSQKNDRLAQAAIHNLAAVCEDMRFVAGTIAKYDNVVSKRLRAREGNDPRIQAAAKTRAEEYRDFEDHWFVACGTLPQRPRRTPVVGDQPRQEAP